MKKEAYKKYDFGVLQRTKYLIEEYVKMVYIKINQINENIYLIFDLRADIIVLSALINIMLYILN